MGGTVNRVGEKNKANNGQTMIIINYRGCNDLDIQFEDGTIVYNKTYHSFKSGNIKHPDIDTKYPNRVGKSKKCTVFNIEYKSFKLACEAFNLNTDTVRSYKDKYKISEEQAIDHYINGTDYSNCDKVNGVRVNNFTKIIIIDGVRYNFKQAIEKFNLSSKGIDKVMQEYNIKDRGDAIIYCIENNLAKSTRKQSGTLEIDGTIFDNITKALKYYHISTANYNKYRKELNTRDCAVIINKILSDRDTKLIRTNIGNFRSFCELCNRIGINNSTVNAYANRKDCKSKLQAITKIVKNSYIQGDILILPDNIELNIKTVDGKKFSNLRKLCSMARIKPNTACAYKDDHPELTDEQVILRYNPFCYYNILGEFTIVPLPEGYTPID